MDRILKRFPARKDILSVYAVVCFMTYSWTILSAFWKLPSWVYNLTVDEIIGVNAYAFTLNLVESLLIMGVLLFFCLVLPAGFLKDDFTVRGTTIALCLLASAMLHLYVNREVDSYENFIATMQTWWLVTLLVLAVLLLIAAKIRLVRVALAELADRLTILLYLFLPLSLIGIVIVIFRNIS